MAADGKRETDEDPAIMKQAPWLKRWAKSISAIVAALGVAAAGIGYLTSGAQFFTGILDHFRGQSEVRNLIASAEERLAHHDYEVAWDLNAKALRLAARNDAASDQQIRIAFKRLEEPAEIGSGAGQPTFAAIVDPVKTALIDHLGQKKGVEKANIEAHIGWANFLRSRDGLPAIDIDEEFQSALSDDPNNFYGHVMRGFWTLWNGRLNQAARDDFAIAMKSDVDPSYATHLIMAAVTNITSDEYMVAALQYADAFRQLGRTIDDRFAGKLMFYYLNALDEPRLQDMFDQALPASEQILLLRWLKQSELSAADQRLADYFIAYYTGRAGSKEEALGLYRTLIATKEGSSPAYDTINIRSQAALDREKRHR